jgi:hypothetical protein
MSVIALGLFYQLIFSKKDYGVGVFLLLGVFIATAFAIKLTTLLLLL